MAACSRKHVYDYRKLSDRRWLIKAPYFECEFDVLIYPTDLLLLRSVIYPYESLNGLSTSV